MIVAKELKKLVEKHRYIHRQYW